MDNLLSNPFAVLMLAIAAGYGAAVALMLVFDFGIAMAKPELVRLQGRLRKRYVALRGVLWMWSAAAGAYVTATLCPQSRLGWWAAGALACSLIAVACSVAYLTRLLFRPLQQAATILCILSGIYAGTWLWMWEVQHRNPCGDLALPVCGLRISVAGEAKEAAANSQQPPTVKRFGWLA